MTTTIKLHVNGRYRAVVKQDGVKKLVEVHGNYEGSPNPSGEHSFSLVHGSIGNKFVISEYPVEDEDKEAQTIEAKDVGNVSDVIDGKAEGSVIEVGVAGNVDTADLKVDFKE